MAWLGATLMFGWARDNVWQWVVPTLTVLAVWTAFVALRVYG